MKPLTTLHNKREKDRNCKLVVHMEGNKTIVTNPNDPNDRRVFTYDHCYWSTDGFKEHPTGRVEADVEHDGGHQYCDQVISITKAMALIVFGDRYLSD